MGKFSKVLEPGLNILLPPPIDVIKYAQSLKEIAIQIPEQSAITVDNVALKLDAVLYLKVQDPYKVPFKESTCYSSVELRQYWKFNFLLFL